MNLNLGLSNGSRTNQPSYNNKSKDEVSPYCGQSYQTVFVNAHEQCLVCKTNVQPCCRGQALKGEKI